MGDILHVDRIAQVAIPKQFVKPVLEQAGQAPEGYDLSKVVREEHAVSREGNVRINRTFERLRRHRLLQAALDLHDGKEIIHSGLFYVHFPRSLVFLWRSAMEDETGMIFTPFMYWTGNKVLLSWSSIVLPLPCGDRTPVSVFFPETEFPDFLGI